MKRIVFISLFIAGSLLFAEENQLNNLKKSTIRSAQYFDANRIKSSILNTGIFARHPINGNSDLSIDGEKLVYSSGIWIGARVNGEIRASLASFATDFASGALDATGVPFGIDFPEFRVYKISRGDNAANNADYADWPAHLGAPIDEFGKPLLIGDQTLWCSFTDAYFENREMNICLPLGAEVHLTAWGWKNITKTMFTRWEIINKSDDQWEGAYFGVFSDPDVGDANNDLICSDSTLSLVCCYDGLPNPYWIRDKAVGYQMLAAPVVYSPGDTAVTFSGRRVNYRNLPVYSPRMEKSMMDQLWNDLPYRNENTALYAYNRLMCLDKNGDPMIDPISEKPTQWAYSGDPVSGNGWLEDIMPRDRRMMLSTGPITVMPGDTNAICLAIMGANNNVRLENITDVKRTAQHLKKYFPDLNLIDVAAEVDIVRFTNTQVELNLKAIFKADAEIASVVAQLYNYDNEFIASTALFDDGANADSISGDNIFSKNVLIDLTDDALYLNLTVDYFGGESATIQCAAENITLTNKIHIDASITADSRNYDGEANPGENIRLKFRVINGYDFTINSFSLTAESKDSLVSFADYSPTIFLRDSIPQQSEIELIDELSLNIDESYPPGNVIQIKLSYADSAHHSWLNYIELPVNEFAYVPNEQMAAHVAGRSDAWFKIMVIVPTDLTGHSYAITINDTLPELKFNLIDETIDSTLIINSALPQQYAYNIPITDGFKVVDAYAPNGGLRDAWYEDVPGGFPRGFVGIRGGGDHVYPGLVEGLAHERDFYAIELEFTNRIDNNGIVGEPAGQLAYCYSMTAGTIPLAVLHNPFNVWKIVFGERAGKLNACYYESIPGNDPLWAPDASVVGGMQKLFIMKSDYDPSGNLYLNTSLNMYDVLYKIFFRLDSDSSVVDAGDQFVIDWVCPLSRYDKFTFIPTNVHEKENIKPESFALFQNYPNPFNHHTKIRFFLDKSTKVSFKIFNIMGQQVFSLNEKKFDSGFHELVWNGNDQSGNRVASGIYCYQVSSGKIKITKKMVLIY